jgi:tRNA(Ile)-lysidine synthase
MALDAARAATRLAVRKCFGADWGDGVLVACSGGADSLALLAACIFEGHKAGVRVVGTVVDHGLQAGSDEHTARVVAQMAGLGADETASVRITVDPGGAGIEAAAREARYAALSQLAAHLGLSVVLGHTLDDQAETVLLGLGRGSGPRSIAGMVPRSGCYGRPLLAVRRATTVAACEALGLPVWDDPANSDPSLQRVRLRREVLPLLEDVLQGGVAEALARTAGLVRDDLDALDGWAARESAVINSAERHPGRALAPVDHETSDGSLDATQLAELPRALRTRVLRAWALERGASELGATHIAALDALVTAWRGQGPLDLPGGLRVLRASGRLQATPATFLE